jgi:MoxR-like ATPase
MLRSLAFLLGHKCRTICLTDETEPSALVGQQCPCDKGGQSERVRWKDGAVTEAFRNGDWILLDNISDADACVLERLNPLLEHPPQCILTENGEIDGLHPNPDFRILATMTCSTAEATERFKELSPAVANRFSIIYVEDTPLGKGVASLANTVLGLADGDKAASKELEAARQISDDIWKHTNEDETAKCLSSPFTFRSFIRFLDCTFLLRLQCPQLTLAQAFWSSYSITVMQQIKVPLGNIA